jgi:hypothetical protein
MVTWYTGDGTANDFFGVNNGMLQNGASFAPGKVGQAFSLNGINQFVTLPTNVIPYPALGSTSNQALSVDAWFQTNTGGVILGQQGIASPPAAPSGAVPAIYVGTDGFLYVELFWAGSVNPISSTPHQVNDSNAPQSEREARCRGKEGPPRLRERMSRPSCHPSIPAEKMPLNKDKT